MISAGLLQRENSFMKIKNKNAHSLLIETLMGNLTEKEHDMQVKKEFLKTLSSKRKSLSEWIAKKE